MKRAPSAKSLLQAFPDCDPKLIRGIIKGTIPPDTIPATAQWIAQCYNRPSIVELKMHAINALVEGHGVEAIMGRSGSVIALYVNTEDTYSPTLLRAQGNYRITSWGDFVERYERRHGRID